MNKAKQKLLTLAKALGVSVFLGSDQQRQEIHLDAPPGHVFYDSELHYMIAFGWGDALDRVEAGVVPCTEVGCEICEDGKLITQDAQEYANFMGWTLLEPGAWKPPLKT